MKLYLGTTDTDGDGTPDIYESDITNWPSRKFVFDPLYNASNDPTFNANMEFQTSEWPKNKNIMQMENEETQGWYKKCKYIVEDEDCNDDGVSGDTCDRLILPNDATFLSALIIYFFCHFFDVF